MVLNIFETVFPGGAIHARWNGGARSSRSTPAHLFRVLLGVCKTMTPDGKYAWSLKKRGLTRPRVEMIYKLFQEGFKISEIRNRVYGANRMNIKQIYYVISRHSKYLIERDGDGKEA